MKLSDKLIELRKTKGWSQEDFAEKLDVSRQAISRWENGTALPDAQNILRIGKLFNVTADFLLDDDYEYETDISTVEIVADETKSLTQKRKHSYWWHLIPAICFAVLASCVIIKVVRDSNAPADQTHTHPALQRVIENEVAPSCTEAGSYEEVLYCVECGEEVFRMRIIKGVPAHQFENEKCIVCGKEQRERAQ